MAKEDWNGKYEDVRKDGKRIWIDVHVRRLRSKLGTEHESLISTVRNVGYRFSAGR